MNLFILSLDPAKIAEYMMDKHIAKIILEAVQMLCTTQRLLVVDQPGGCDPCVYKIAHKNHPVTIWCRASQANFIWTLDLIDAMHTEWKYRYGHPAHKQHKSYNVAQYLRDNIPPADAFERVKTPGIMTPFALAMPDEFKIRMAAAGTETGTGVAPTGTSHGADIYDAVASYRSYYLSEPKRRIAKWAKLREMPLWYTRGLRKIQGRPAPKLVVVKHLNTSLYENIPAKVEIMTSHVDRVFAHIGHNADKRIVLLRIREVVMWLFGDLSFLGDVCVGTKTSNNAKYKILEDKWGQETLKLRRPDLLLDKQWTNKMGEHLCEEILMLQGKNVTKPANKNHYQPDSEVDDGIWEAKIQTYYTSGTAGEKILGVPFKYAEIPVLYSKPLKILCMAGAEKVCREQYGNLDGGKCSDIKRAFLEFYKTNGVEFVGATDILRRVAVVAD